ncbi:MAG: beta-ketoacyl synthase [Myxococcales bacterium]|nr:beta-ketoacyl synthase [Myxococcales bacterium]
MEGLVFWRTVAEFALSSGASSPSAPRRIGVFGLGVIAPGAANVAALVARLSAARTGLAPTHGTTLGDGLFLVGDPDFSFETYAPWITARHGDASFARLRTKCGENVQLAIGATIQALETDPRLERAAKELDEACHVYVGSGVGDLPESYAAVRSLDRAVRDWNHFWADPTRCSARHRFEGEGQVPDAAPPPPAPETFAADSAERFDAIVAWDAYWAALSDGLRAFLERFRAIEELAADDTDGEKAHLSAIRKRTRAQRALTDELGCPPPPWTAVSANLIWNIQNAPAAQITMLLGVHGEAWAPVGACSTFGVALKCGRDAILRGDAKMAIVGTTDPRPDPALCAAFYGARVMPGTGKVNAPFTSLRGTHLSGGSCVWILGDADYFAERGLEPAFGYVDAVALSSDAEHIITPSRSGPKVAIRRAYQEAGIGPADVAVIDLHATGTPGDLNELALVHEFTTDTTRITARKGQLGHGMANAGGWELTALALSLKDRVALPTGIPKGEIHPKALRRENIVTDAAPLGAGVGVKLMLGIGGITACVVLRGR